MGELTFRQMRAIEVGLLQVAPTIARQRAQGWVLLEDHVSVRGKLVRLVFGKAEREEQPG